MDRREALALALGGLSLAAFSSASSEAQSRFGLKGSIRTNWSRDRYSFGSYSYIAKGASQRDTRRLAEPIADRIFFAGEATHPRYNSTVHAAYETGVSAVQAVAKTQARNVIVIGAGVSGLAAASQLVAQGKTVTVLEARQRIGGRIWTDRRLGVPLDLGASWIHGTRGNPITKLSDRLGIQRKTTGGSYLIRGRGGRVLNDREAPGWLEEVVEIQHSAGAEREKINMGVYWNQPDYEGRDVAFPGGYSQIFAGLRGGYDTRLGAEVSRVSLTGQGVEIGLSGGGRVSADAVVVTLPLGVLKQNRVVFSPGLSAEKRQAIRRLGFGTLDKVYLYFDRPFWDLSTTWIATPDNELPPGQFNQWLNLYNFTGRPIIMAFNGGEAALALGGMPEKEVIRRAVRTLELAYLG